MTGERVLLKENVAEKIVVDCLLFCSEAPDRIFATVESYNISRRPSQTIFQACNAAFHTHFFHGIVMGKHRHGCDKPNLKDHSINVHLIDKSGKHSEELKNYVFTVNRC